MLGTRKSVGLEENEGAVELADARGFERGANFDGVMAVVVDDGDIVDDALDIEAATDACKFGEAFADQIAWDI